MHCAGTDLSHGAVTPSDPSYQDCLGLGSLTHCSFPHGLSDRGDFCSAGGEDEDLSCNLSCSGTAEPL